MRGVSSVMHFPYKWKNDVNILIGVDVMPAWKCVTPRMDFSLWSQGHDLWFLVFTLFHVIFDHLFPSQVFDLISLVVSKDEKDLDQLICRWHILCDLRPKKIQIRFITGDLRYKMHSTSLTCTGDGGGDGGGGQYHQHQHLFHLHLHACLGFGVQCKIPAATALCQILCWYAMWDSSHSYSSKYFLVNISNILLVCNPLPNILVDSANNVLVYHARYIIQKYTTQGIQARYTYMQDIPCQLQVYMQGIPCKVYL